MTTPQSPRSGGCRENNADSTLDMINIFKFTFKPNTVQWVHQPGAGQTLLAVSDLESSTIRIFDGRGDGKALYELDKIHRAPVHLMAVSCPVRMENQADGSTTRNTIASFQPMKRALSSTGSPVNLGDYLPFKGFGNSNLKRIFSSSKRSAEPSRCVLYPRSRCIKGPI